MELELEKDVDVGFLEMGKAGTGEHGDCVERCPRRTVEGEVGNIVLEEEK